MNAQVMIPFPKILYSNRLMIRRLVEDDLETLHRWSNSADAYGSYLSPELLDKEQITLRFHSGLFWNECEKLFLIEHKDRTPLGTIHYWLPADKMDIATVALKIAEPDERNKGYGTEAQKSLLIYLFDKMKIKQVEMYTDLDNLAQQRCLKKLGFSLIETLTYDDAGIRRTGNLYRLDEKRYQQEPIYRYHYE